MTTKKSASKAHSAREFLEEASGGPLTFGGLIHSIREGEDMTLAAFASRLAISRQYLCDLEKGRRAVSPLRAAEWATTLGYSEVQFVRLALQDQISQAGLKLKVSVSAT